MPTFTKHAAGTFSWMELMTTDVARAKSFYGELMGWTFEDSPAGPGMVYTMVRSGEHMVAGMFARGAEMAAVPPSWSAYVTVEDVDAATKKVSDLGGTVLKQPFDVMDVGRMSVAADPTGGAFCMWQAKQHIGAGVKAEVGAMCWNELYTTNVDASGKFLTSLFGWSPQAMDMGPAGTYTVFKPTAASEQGEMVAGMMAMPEGMGGPSSSYWLTYVQVANVDASTKKAVELGAKEMIPPSDIPGMGRFSIIADPTGAVIGLFGHA